MLKINKVGLFNLAGQQKVNNILYACGKDMAQKYDLNHWNNSHLKNALIVVLCELKNNVYLVMENNVPVGTFQTRVEGSDFHFEKFATHPSASGKGVGTYCLDAIEQMAKDAECKRVCMEVYALSENAKRFYENRNYKACGETKTLKYCEVKMEKIL